MRVKNKVEHGRLSSHCLIKLSTNSINKTLCRPQQEEMQEKWHKQGKQTATARAR